MYKLPPSKDEIMARTRRDLSRSRKVQFASAAVGFGMGFMSAATHAKDVPGTDAYEYLTGAAVLASVVERRLRFVQTSRRVNSYARRFLTDQSTNLPCGTRLLGIPNSLVQMCSLAAATGAGEYVIGWDDKSFAVNTAYGLASGVGAILLTFPLGEKMNEQYIQNVQEQLDAIDATRLNSASS